MLENKTQDAQIEDRFKEKMKDSMQEGQLPEAVVQEFGNRLHGVMLSIDLMSLRENQENRDQDFSHFQEVHQNFMRLWDTILKEMAEPMKKSERGFRVLDSLSKQRESTQDLLSMIDPQAEKEFMERVKQLLMSLFKILETDLKF